MKQFLPYLEKLQTHLTLNITKMRHYYHKLNSKQKMVLLAGFGLIVLLLLFLSITGHTNKVEHNTFKTQFESTSEPKLNMSRLSSTARVIQQSTPLHQQLTQAKRMAKQQYQNVNAKLNTIQENLASVATQQSVSQLQQTVSTPNPTLVNKVDHLQASVKQIMAQTEKKIFVPPKTVEQYFRLVAIQVFSDGMRAIIDVNGHQALLSANEVCPACRGWRLKSMDFANQKAIFENGQQQYVQLKTN